MRQKDDSCIQYTQPRVRGGRFALEVPVINLSIKCFEHIVGYDDLKHHVVKMFSQVRSMYRIGFFGPPAGAKSLFMEAIWRAAGMTCPIILGGKATATQAGIAKFFWDNSPELICVDEADKLPNAYWDVFSGIAESGYISSIKANKHGIDQKFNPCRIVLAGNDYSRVPGFIRSRVDDYHLPAYDPPQFTEVTVRICSSNGIFTEVGLLVAKRILQLPDPDIRDVLQFINCGIKTVEDVETHFNLKNKYKYRGAK